jgi:(+)-pinoresinol hydroxylase
MASAADWGALVWYPDGRVRGNREFQKALAKPEGPTDQEFDRFAADHSLHAWQVDLQFYGPERTTAANWDYAKDLFRERIPNVKIYDGKGFKIPIAKEQLLKKNELPYPANIPYDPAFGVPNLKNWRFLGRSDAEPDGSMTGDAGFYPVIPRKGEELLKFQRAFGAGLWNTFGFNNPQSGVGLVDALSIPVSSFPTAYQMRVFVYTSQSDKEHNAKVHRALQQMAGIAAEYGWGDYRSPPIYQDIVAKAYSFSDHALRRFHETIKDSVDPNGILSPGRGGIWPAAYRNFRRA